MHLCQEINSLEGGETYGRIRGEVGRTCAERSRDIYAGAVIWNAIRYRYLACCFAHQPFQTSMACARSFGEASFAGPKS